MYRLRDLKLVFPKDVAGYFTIKDGYLMAGNSEIIVFLKCSKFPKMFRSIASNKSGDYHREHSGQVVTCDIHPVQNLLCNIVEATDVLKITPTILHDFRTCNDAPKLRRLEDFDETPHYVSEKYLQAVFDLAEETGHPITELRISSERNTVGFFSADGSPMATLPAVKI